jgi:hypothetical protein
MFVVTGMHRSGTSAVCNLLWGLGMDFGEDAQLLPTDRWNAKGYFENQDVFLLNTFVITGSRRLARLWLIPFEERTRLQKLMMMPVKARYLLMPDTDRLAKRMERSRGRVEEVTTKIGGLVVKDPRFCLLIEPWYRYATVEKVLFSHRHPTEVAQSLHRREGLPMWLGYKFWSYHVASFLKQMDRLEMDVTMVNYNHLFDAEKREEEARRLFRFAGREFDEGEWSRIASTSFESQLRHHRGGDAKVPAEVRELLVALEEKYRQCDGSKGSTPSR